VNININEYLQAAEQIDREFHTGTGFPIDWKAMTFRVAEMGAAAVAAEQKQLAASHQVIADMEAKSSARTSRRKPNPVIE
jgi:hypothetical protein